MVILNSADLILVSKKGEKRKESILEKYYSLFFDESDFSKISPT